MRNEMSLDRDSLTKRAAAVFRQVPDFRDTRLIGIELKVFLMGGLRVFSLKYPSLLIYEEHARGNIGRSIRNMFRLDKVHFMLEVLEVKADSARFLLQNSSKISHN